MMANLDIVKAVDNNLYRTVVDNLTECLTEYQYFIKSKFFKLEFWFHRFGISNQLFQGNAVKFLKILSSDLLKSCIERL